MRKKLFAVLTAIVVMTGCQAVPMKDNSAQNELPIESETATKNDDKDETSTQNQNNESNLEIKSETDTEISDSNQDTLGQDDEESEQEILVKEALGRIENQESSAIQDIGSGKVVAEIPSEDGRYSESVNVFRFDVKGIPGDMLEEGVVEAYKYVYDFNAYLNSEELKTIELSGIYESYWALKDPFTSLDQVRERLKRYFTDETIESLINNWGLIEVNELVLAPELSTGMDFDPTVLNLKISDVNVEAGLRYFNLGTVNGLGEKVQSLLKVRETESGYWKLDTVPGTGQLRSYKDKFIRDESWGTRSAQWSWPEFIGKKDEMWIGTLDITKFEITERIHESVNIFEQDEAFEKWGIPQLKYWITWAYRNDNPQYPSVDVVVSEYMKYSIHPNHSRMTINMSEQTGKPIELSDLYTEQELFYESVNVFIDVHMRENKEAFYNDIVFSGINEDTQFYLTKDGIVFYFQLYEYAPYAYGYPEVVVPFSVLSESLIPELKSLMQED